MILLDDSCELGISGDDYIEVEVSEDNGDRSSGVSQLAGGMSFTTTVGIVL
jgi:hypothetical protein